MLTSTADSTGVPFPPVEVASQFFSGINEPRPTSLDFSLDGLLAVSSHLDDAVRLIDVNSMTHSETIQCPISGVSSCCFTQSSSVLCVSPRLPKDGHLYLLNLESANIIGALAYVNDFEQEVKPTSLPVYSTLAQCPTTDIIGGILAAKKALVLFHPLISGAVASTSDDFVQGEKPCLHFSRDGNTIIVGGENHISLLDRRKLNTGPFRRFDHSQIFQFNPTRCRGFDMSACGEKLFVTSSKGEVNVLNIKSGAVECTYFHHDVRRLFDGTANMVAAKCITPFAASSRVVQMTSSMNDGRHMLVYHPDDYLSKDTQIQSDSPSSSPFVSSESNSVLKEGMLQYQLQSKDSELPVAIAVNPRFQMLATAARHVTWWSFSD